MFFSLNPELQRVQLRSGDSARLLLEGVYNFKAGILEVMCIAGDQPQLMMQCSCREETVDGRHRASDLSQDASPAVGNGDIHGKHPAFEPSVFSSLVVTALFGARRIVSDRIFVSSR